MRIVGRRQMQAPIEVVANSGALRSGLAVVDAAASFGWAISTGQRKGVYRFASFEAMEQHRVDSLAAAMAERAKAAAAAPR